jgi:hypothetical protein
MAWSPQLLSAGLMVGLVSIIVQIRRAGKGFQNARRRRGSFPAPG